MSNRFIRFSLYVSAAAATLINGEDPAKASSSATYTYDALGRLIQSNMFGSINNGVQVTTSYDPAGNRAAQQVSGSSMFFRSHSTSTNTDVAKLDESFSSASLEKSEALLNRAKN